MHLRCALSVLLLILASATALPQSGADQKPKPSRDPAAVAAIRQSLLSMGGQPVTSAVVSGTMAVGTDHKTTKAIVIKIAGREMRVEVQSGEDNYLYVTGTGTPGRVLNGKSEAVPPHQARALASFYVPSALLTRELADPLFALTYIGQETREGHGVLHIRTIDTSDEIGVQVSQQDWYFDLATYLPVAVQYRFPHPYQVGRFSKAVAEYDGFKQIQGTIQPLTIKMKGGGPPREIAVSTVLLNAGTSTIDFDPVAGGAR